MANKKYDTTVARMAGNIAAGLVGMNQYTVMGDSWDHIIRDRSIKLAKAIVKQLTDEVKEKE